MCGIVGVFNYRSNSGVDPHVLARMRDAMVHRGPDGSGLWVSEDQRLGFGHRRLSIIDLSTAAAQPMCNEDGRIWITFNGEIYNHLELRGELVAAGHVFRTDHSDTEVLIHGYEQWGMAGLLRRISGDYAFAIWDQAQNKLLLARDRIGVKPLYFSLHNGSMLFASEIKALLEYPGLERDISPQAMYHYLSFMTTPAPLTMFHNIFKLPAGYYLELPAGGSLKATRYWNAVPGQGIAPGETAGLSESAIESFYVNGVRTRLEAAVKRRMMSDVPFGVFLSGGVDSSTNVALMSQLMNRPVDTFTVGFKDHQHLNELQYAHQIAERFKTNHHEVLIDEKDMVGYLDDLIHHQDEPVADWVCIPLYFVSKLTRDNGVTMIQVGEGADEQFSGYASYLQYLDFYHRYWLPFRKHVPKPLQFTAAALARAAARLRPGVARYADLIDRAARDREHFWSGATVFFDLMKHQLVDGAALRGKAPAQELADCGLLPDNYLQADSFNVISSFLGPFDASHPQCDALTRMIHNEFKLRLPELLLMRVDKITMSTSLEARVPFLDHDMVEFSMDIPESWKTRNGTAKYLLKKAVEGLIPHDIIYRKKMGFGAPMSNWLRGEFGRIAEQQVLSCGLLKRGYFKIDYIQRLFDEHRSGRRENGVYLWTLFNLTSWYDYWIELKGIRGAASEAGARVGAAEVMRGGLHQGAVA